MTRQRNTVRHLRRSGFTLNELIVVLGTLTMLMGLLIPVLSRAQSVGKKTTCISNLKQASLAYLMYTGDYDDSSVLTLYFVDEGDYAYQEWYGLTVFENSVAYVDLNKSLLNPYTKSYAIMDCMEAKDIPNKYLYPMAYGYNDALSPFDFDLLEWVSINLGEVEIPSETIIFADVAMFFDEFGIEREVGLSCGSPTGPYAHARHIEKAVVTWVDGHASAHSLYYRKTDFELQHSLHISASNLKAHHLGDVLKYPKESPLSQHFTDRDCYYYVLDKPNS